MESKIQIKGQHTPGPWHIEDWKYEGGTVRHIVQNQKDAICEVWDLWCMDERAPEREANAHLIAAAPEMYDALDPERLEAIATEIDSFEHSARARSLRILANQQRTAMAKAEGK